jgi:hypothetical protein
MIMPNTTFPLIISSRNCPDVFRMIAALRLL